MHKIGQQIGRCLQNVDTKIEQNNSYDFPNITCANVRSIANKIDEIAIEMDRNKIDFTEP